MAEKAATYIVYDGAIPLLFVQGQSRALVEAKVGEAFADIPRERLRFVLAREAPVEEVQKIVAILHGEWLLAQFHMMRQLSGPIQLVGRPS
jgi:hypothetical protein